MILNEAVTHSPTDRLMQILLESHTLEVGRSGDLFHMDFETIKPLLTTSWITQTLEFTDTFGIDIRGNTAQLKHWCTGDSMIMDDIIGTRGTTFSDEEMEGINRCRLYLQVVTRSDLTEGDGKTIRPEVWECEKTFNSTSAEAYRWPAQPRPGPQSRAR